MTVVLDSSALLAALQDEPGADVVRAEFHHAIIGTVNLAEVVGVLRKKGNGSDQVQATIGELSLPVIAPDEHMAMLAGLWRPDLEELGLSLGDRFCLALGHSLGCSILTADRAWLGAGETLGLEVHLIR